MHEPRKGKHHRAADPSGTQPIDEPIIGYTEMMEYRNSTRGHLIALEIKIALECYLEEMIKGTKMKQKAYGTLFSSKVHAETVDQ